MTDGFFQCDRCGKPFLPEEGCYIGPIDPDDTCSPMMAMIGEWVQLCEECNE